LINRNREHERSGILSSAPIELALMIKIVGDIDEIIRNLIDKLLLERSELVELSFIGHKKIKNGFG